MQLNFKRLIIEEFSNCIEVEFKRAYGTLDVGASGFIAWLARFALENIANSDMLYHNVEHTMLVTTVGQQILIGKHLIDGGVTPGDWVNMITALLCHDIGYVSGICKQDGPGICATGINNETVELSPGGTDAALTPYHVNRGQQFVRERFADKMLVEFMDVNRVCSYIEMTRFPPPNDPAYQDTASYAGLVRAADFIGQLGDPDYVRKVPALFYEFEQFGANQENGYKNPGDMRKGYAGFFWKVVKPFIGEAVRYLNVTQAGKQWVAGLYAHVFSAEHFEQI